MSESKTGSSLESFYKNTLNQIPSKPRTTQLQIEMANLTQRQVNSSIGIGLFFSFGTMFLHGQKQKTVEWIVLTIEYGKDGIYVYYRNLYAFFANNTMSFRTYAFIALSNLF